jgi:hypothetical protein
MRSILSSCRASRAKVTASNRPCRSSGIDPSIIRREAPQDGMRRIACISPAGGDPRAGHPPAPIAHSRWLFRKLNSSSLFAAGCCGPHKHHARLVGAEWSMPVRQPSGFRIFAPAKGGGNPLGPPPSLPAGCLSLSSLRAAWSGDERPDRPGSRRIRGRTRSPQPVREEGPGGADGPPVERARAVAGPHRPAAIGATLAPGVTAERSIPPVLARSVPQHTLGTVGFTGRPMMMRRVCPGLSDGYVSGASATLLMLRDSEAFQLSREGEGP